MSVSDEQLKWFNSLPYFQRQAEGDKFEKTCPCGATLWYNLENSTENVYSWINIHFEHTAEEVRTKTPFVYDWNIAWKFSIDGFAAFKEEFGLKFQDSNRNEVNGYIVETFSDDAGNRFVFKEGNRNIQHETENHWATFVPSMSAINL